jgi:hypothetical protein
MRNATALSLKGRLYFHQLFALKKMLTCKTKLQNLNAFKNLSLDLGPYL